MNLLVASDSFSHRPSLQTIPYLRIKVWSHDLMVDNLFPYAHNPLLATGLLDDELLLAV